MATPITIGGARGQRRKPVVSGRVGIGGFTLLELLVTVSIATVMLVIAVPSYQAIVLNGRRLAVANEFVLALSYARSEAVKRGTTITVCSRATDATCADSTEWDNGWLVFVDNRAGSAGTVGVVDTDEQVLSVYATPPNGTTLRAGSRKSVTFRATGFSAGCADTFRLCDRRGTASARSIALFNQGWVRTAAGTESCP